MVEMTAQEAKIFIAQELKELSGPEGCCIQTMQRNQTKRNNFRGLAALIEQQQQQIEQQAAEIAKKDSLICKLKTCRTCNFVMADRCDKHDRLVDNPMREKCDDWQWLEKEAQGVE